MGVEVIVGKVLHEDKSVIEFQIVPDEFAEVGGTAKLFQLVNVSSEGAYLHAQHENIPEIEFQMDQLLYLGPLYGGWSHDPAHQLELVRDNVLQQNGSYSYWTQSMKAGISILRSPKWTTTNKNSCKHKIKLQKIFIFLGYSILGAFNQSHSENL